MEERLARAGARLKRPDDDDDDSTTQPTSLLLLLPPSGPTVTVVLTTASSSSSSLWDDFFTHYFALQPGECVDTQLLQAQAEAARQCEDDSSGGCPHVSPATLQRAAAEGTVQRIQKYNNNNSQDNLCLYYDESASFKQRPFNERATQYAREWAQDAVPEPVDDIYGDAFLVQRDGATT